jgi:hypothetical protein
MSKVALTIFYAQGSRLSINDKSFKEVMQMVWKSEPFKNQDPLKTVFTTTGKTLYMDKQAFHSFLNGNLSQQELIELTECDELYRNKKDFTSENGIVIDAGSLWKAHRKELILIDDDNLFSTKMDSTIFEIAE